MTLWLPWIDAAKSYESIFTSVQNALPNRHGCVNGLDVGQSQRMLFHYYTGVKLRPVDNLKSDGNKTSCRFYLIQDEKGTAKVQLGDEWKQIWQGKRAADRKESFRLYQRR